MPVPKRQSKMRQSLSPAQLQWLTGEPQEGTNLYEMLGFDHPCQRRDIEQMKDTLARADDVVSRARIAALRKQVADLEKKVRR